MEILKFPSTALLLPCEEVTSFDDDLTKTLEEMWLTMKSNSGRGLAANQVGLSRRMFVMEGPLQEKLFVVNPIILSFSGLPANLREGCLSAPGDFTMRQDRPSWVEVQFHDNNGLTNRKVFKDIFAVCFMHELEHLDGKAFFDSEFIPRKERKRLMKKWKIK